METPFFLIDRKILDDNIQNFKTALGNIWPNSKIAYSVKTNSLPWLLKYLNENKIMAEVVSDEEYQLALLCGFNHNEIVFNGPIKGEKLFLDSLHRGSILNVDSKHEVELFKKSVNKNSENIGIRINIDTSIFDNNDISYIDDGFRFGFSEKNDNFAKMIDTIRLNNSSNKIGLHFHCNSVTRSLKVYRKIAEYARYIIEKYNISPSFIDIGGGFFGGIEGQPTATEYITEIYEVLKNTINTEDTMLIVEPGSAIIGSAVEFHTSVKDVKDNGKSKIITTDGSRINIDPLWSKNKYTYRVETSKINSYHSKKQIVCGYTCMDHDRIMTLLDENTLFVGDKLVFEKVGAYSMTFAGPFIRYFPEVYVQDECNTKLVRKKINARNYYDIHTNLGSGTK